ncbi:MAG: hypothetical protein RLZZ385_746 [Pseudomonadota bacterium]|jgi:1-acyl-sn-glycerol-3-phosphate acyltransferase
MASIALYLRSAMFYLGYYLSTLVISPVCILGAWIVPRSRRYVFYNAWCQFIMFWFRVTVGVRYEITGLENLTGKPVVVLSNHQSEWETIFLYNLLAPVCPILKRELLNIPFWGWALRLQQPIAIDRSKPHEAGKSILTQGVDRIRRGMSVIIFPEGSRIKTGKLKKFSRGGAKLAIAAGVPILPVAHNAGYCWPPHRYMKYPGTIRLTVGAPVDTTNGDASELTERVEAWIRSQDALKP